MVFPGGPTLSVQDLLSDGGCVESGGPPAAQQCSGVTWRDVSVFVKKRPQRGRCWGKRHYDLAEQKQLLRGVSGEARAGELLGVLGASGAGKSTLLNVLTGRSVGAGLRVEGRVSGAGAAAAYVQQQDLFIATLTVTEHLTFQALLRMDRHCSRQQRMRRVEEVIAELGLSKCAATRIGAAGQGGISGGEAKRLAFASEVLCSPALLVCDEPTSGLDSSGAYSVLDALRGLARGGRTLVASVHQPASDAFALFDRLLLLAEGGRVAFHGTPRAALAFFERCGHRCPAHYNPADFYVHTLAVAPGRETEARSRVDAICDQFAKEESGGGGPTRFLMDSEKEPSHSKRLYRTGWCAQFRATLWRSWISMSRDLMTTKVRFGQAVGLGLLLGAVFWGQSADEKGVSNLNGILFILLMNISFSNMMAVINVFMFEQPVFLREHRDGLYTCGVYFLSKTLAEAPIIVGSTVLHVAIVYWMVGLHSDSWTFLLNVAIQVLVANVSASYGYMVSCLSSSMNMALSLSVPMLMPIVLFGGFFLNVGSMPAALAWLKYVSWVFYGNEAVTVNQWRDIHNITCTTNRCASSGAEVLESLEFEEANMVRDVALLCVLLVGFRALAFLALLRKAAH